MVERKIDRLILKMVEKIRTKYEPEKIILFGSYAHGKSTKDSDVDLFIIKNDPSLPLERSVEIRRILCQENRKIALTVLVYTPREIEHRLSIGDDFVEEALTKGQVLYAK